MDAIHAFIVTYIRTWNGRCRLNGDSVCVCHMAAFAAHCLTRFLYSLMSLASRRAASWLAGEAVLGSLSSDWMDDSRLLTV